ncbi:inositol monophosphatase family protein [Nocardioides gilvus]|uniref:inositol monophosphatase family protein n=1 Tax=Nocardioides gilvus TaxID=1735589 RepID=UPI000D74955F|nr:inositol monophosphatase [Nocardioides gilvus]
MSVSLAADLALAESLVHEAADLAARWFRQGVDGEAKLDATDLVTVADRSAEEHVLEVLGQLRPADGVIGEEGAFRPGTSARRWVIDPVDGTYNFVRGLERWCSALALTDGEELQVGAVHDAVRGTGWVGSPAVGAFRDGIRLPQLADRDLSTACAATYLHPPHVDGPVGERWRRVLAGLGTYRSLGSGSLDAVAVAEGRIDLLFQHSVPDWDRLPGEAIIRAVGGTSRVVEGAGVSWYVAGAPTAVARASDLLADR